MSNIEKSADLLMYKGPDINNLILNAIASGYSYEMLTDRESKILTVHQTLAYGTQISDKYLYNNEDQLIKQLLIINGKEKVVFDKYKEIKVLLTEIDVNKKMIS